MIFLLKIFSKLSDFRPLLSWRKNTIVIGNDCIEIYSHLCYGIIK